MAAAFDRASHCRRISSSGGRRTVELHGTSHMQSIGRRGFQKAVELGWGLELAAKLADGYRAKYGRPLRLGPEPRRKARIRAEARRLYGGLACDRCAGAPGQVHHIEIDDADPNRGGLIRVLCAACHRAEHRRVRLDHLRGRADG